MPEPSKFRDPIFYTFRQPRATAGFVPNYHAHMAQQKIVRFHTDESEDWVADLACGHTQHVRHRPPWELRPWVTTEEGRRAHLGCVLECKKCDEQAVPQD